MGTLAVVAVTLAGVLLVTAGCAVYFSAENRRRREQRRRKRRYLRDGLDHLRRPSASDWSGEGTTPD